MTNAFLFKRHVLSSPACDWCPNGLQTDLHIPRDCLDVLRVWKIMVPTGWWDFFCRLVNIVHWFKTN